MMLGRAESLRKNIEWCAGSVGHEGWTAGIFRDRCGPDGYAVRVWRPGDQGPQVVTVPGPQSVIARSKAFPNPFLVSPDPEDPSWSIIATTINDLVEALAERDPVATSDFTASQVDQALRYLAMTLEGHGYNSNSWPYTTAVRVFSLLTGMDVDTVSELARTYPATGGA
jgi:hypothetical protein